MTKTINIYTVFVHMLYNLVTKFLFIKIITRTWLFVLVYLGYVLFMKRNFSRLFRYNHNIPIKKSHITMTLFLNGRDDTIRTCDPFVPSEVRYQTALHPDINWIYLIFNGLRAVWLICNRWSNRQLVRYIPTLIEFIWFSIFKRQPFYILSLL